jgi:hypothetical protein
LVPITREFQGDLLVTLRGYRLAELILLCRDPVVKSRETKTPVLAHADTRYALFACKPLKGFYVDAEKVRCLLCCQQGFKHYFCRYQLVSCKCKCLHPRTGVLATRMKACCMVCECALTCEHTNLYRVFTRRVLLFKEVAFGLLSDSCRTSPAVSEHIAGIFHVTHSAVSPIASIASSYSPARR